METVQGTIYEGIFKTFSHDFDVVLELAHKVDNSDPQKLNAQEVVECLIFHSKDIVYMSAQNIEPNYALKGWRTNLWKLPNLSPYCDNLRAAHFTVEIDD